MRGLLTKVLVIIMAANAIGAAKDLRPSHIETQHSFSKKVSADPVIASTDTTANQGTNRDAEDLCTQCHLGHCAFVLPSQIFNKVSLQISNVDFSTESTLVNRSIAPPSKPPKSA